MDLRYTEQERTTYQFGKIPKNKYLSVNQDRLCACAALLSSQSSFSRVGKAKHAPEMQESRWGIVLGNGPAACRDIFNAPGRSH
jgi:hypothetical protein